MATPSTYAHFKCNDDAASTVVTDDGSGSNNGVASVNTSILSATGKIGKAFEFNGTDEFVAMNAFGAAVKGDTAASVSIWAYSIDNDAGTVWSFENISVEVSIGIFEVYLINLKLPCIS